MSFIRFHFCIEIVSLAFSGSCFLKWSDIQIISFQLTRIEFFYSLFYLRYLVLPSWKYFNISFELTRIEFYTPCCKLRGERFFRSIIVTWQSLSSFSRKDYKRYLWHISQRSAFSLVYVLLGCDFTLNQQLSVLRYFCSAFYEFALCCTA